MENSILFHSLVIEAHFYMETNWNRTFLTEGVFFNLQCTKPWLCSPTFLMIVAVFLCCLRLQYNLFSFSLLSPFCLNARFRCNVFIWEFPHCNVFSFPSLLRNDLIFWFHLIPLKCSTCGCRKSEAGPLRADRKSYFHNKAPHLSLPWANHPWNQLVTRLTQLFCFRACWKCGSLNSIMTLKLFLRWW